MAGEVARLFIEVGGSVDGAVREIRTLDSAIGTMGRSVAATGAGMTAALTLPLAGIGGAALAASAEFESSFAGVRKTVQFTREELNALGHTTGDMAADSEAAFGSLAASMREMAKTKPIDVNELNAIGEAAGALGVKSTDIKAFTDTIADMGVTTNMTSEMAGDMMARFANVSGMANDGIVEWDRLGATIVDLGNKTAATEQEIMKMGVRIAGAGTIVGMMPDQILSFAASLASVGIRAEAGGSSISTAMIKMSQYVTEGGSKLETLARTAGMTAAEFKYAFQDDAASAISAFTQGLARMDAASDGTFKKVQELVASGMDVEAAFDAVGSSGENVFNVLKELGLADIRVRNAMLALGNSGNLLTDTLRTGAQAWANNTALTEEASKRYATVESQMILAKNRIYDVAITLGDAMKPALMVVMQALNQAIVVLGRMAVAFANLPAPVRTTATLFLGAVAAAGPLIGVFGLMLTAVGMLVSPLGILAIALSGLGAAMVSNVGGVRDMAMAFLQSTGVIQAFGRLAKFAVDAVTLTLYNLSTGADPLTAALYGISIASGDLWGTFWKLLPVVDAIRGGLAFLSQVGAAVQTTFSAMQNGMNPLAALFFGLASSGLVPIATIVQLGNALQTLRDIFSTVWGTIGPIISTYATMIGTALQFLINNFGMIAGAVLGGAAAFGAWGPLAAMVTGALAGLAPIAAGLASAWGVMVGLFGSSLGILGGLGGIFFLLQAALQTFLIDLATYGVGAFASLAASSAWAGGMSLLVGTLQAVGGAIALLFSPMFLFVATAAIIAAAWQTNAGQIIGVVMTLVNTMTTVAALMAPVWANAFQQVLLAIQTAFAYVPQIATTALTHIQSIANSVSTILIGAFQALAPVINMAFGMLPMLVGAFMPLLGSVINLVGTVLAGAFATVAPIAVGVFQAVSNAIQAVLPALLSLAMTVINGLYNVFLTLAPIAAGVFAQLASAAQTVGPIIAGIGQTIGTNIAQAIQLVIPYVQSFFMNLNALATMAGPILIGLAGIIGQFLVTAFQTLAPVVQTAFGLLPQIVAAAMPILAGLGNVLMTIATVALTAVGAAVQFVQNNWSAFAGVISVVGSILQSIIGFIGGALIGGLNTLGTVMGVVGGLAQTLGQFFVFAFSQLEPALAPIIPVFQNLATVIGSQVLPFFAQVGSVVSSVVLPVLGTIAAVVGGLLVGAFISLVAFVAGAIPGLANIFTGVFTIIAGVIQTFIGVVQLVGGLVRAMFTADMPQALSIMQTAFSNIFAGIGTILQGAIQTIGGIIRAIAGGIIAVFENLYMVLVGGSIVPDLIMAIVTLFTNFDLGPLAQAAIQGVVTAFSSLIQSLPALAGQAFQAVGNVFGNAGNFLGGLVRTMTGQQQQEFAAGTSALPDTAANAWSQVEAQFAGQAPNIAAQTMQVAQAATDAWSTSLMYLAETAGNVWSMVYQVFQTHAQAVVAITTASATTIVTTWQESLMMLTAMTMQSWEAMSGITTMALALIVTEHITAWTTISALSMASWTAENALWTTSWTMLTALTLASWTTIASTWTTNWQMLTSLDLASWAMTTALWTSSWTLLTTLTTTSLTTIATIWLTAWQTIVAADLAAWTALVATWDAGHTALQDSTYASMMMIGEGFASASAMFVTSGDSVVSKANEIASAMDDIRDAAEEAAAALAAVGAAGTDVSFAPEITPGSPPPMAFALWDIAGAGDDARRSLNSLGDAGGKVSIGLMMEDGGMITIDDFVFQMEHFAQIATQIATVVATLGDTLDEDATSAIENLTSSIDAITSSFSGLMESIVELRTFATEQAEILQSSAIIGLIIAVADALANIATMIAQRWFAVAALLAEETPQASDILAKSVTSAVNGMTALMDTLVDLQTFANEHGELLWREKTVAMIVAVADALANIGGMVVARWYSIAASVAAEVPGASETLGNSVTSAVNGMSSLMGVLTTMEEFATEHGNLLWDANSVAMIVAVADALANIAGMVVGRWSAIATTMDTTVVDASRALADGISAAASGFEGTIEALQALAEFSEEPVIYTQALEQTAQDLAVAALSLATLWATTAEGFELIATDGAGPLGSTLQAAMSGFEGVVGLLQTLASWTEEPIVYTAAMAQAALELAGHAVNLATVWAKAAKGFELVANDGTGPLGDTLQGAMSGFEGVVSVLQTLASWTKAPVVYTLQMEQAANTLVGHAVSLAGIWAKAAKGFELVANDGTGPLGDTLQGAMDGYEGVIGILAALDAFAEEPIELTTAIKDAALVLAGHAVSLAGIWAKAAKGFELVANDGTGPLTDTLQSAMDGYEAVIGILQALASFAEEPIELSTAIKDAALVLAGHAVSLAGIWAKAAKGFELVANDGVGPLGDTLQGAMDGYEAVIAILQALSSFSEEPIEFTRAMRMAAERLAGYAVELATTWAEVGLGFDLIANDGTGPLSDTLTSLVDALGGVIDILKLLSSWTAEPIQFTQLMGAHAYNLMLHALALATAWAGVGEGFDLIANDGTGPLSDTLSSLSNALSGVVDILKLLSSWTEEPIQFTMLMGAHAYNLMLHARNLATAWAGVAVGFELVANDGTGPLSDTLSSLSNALSGVVDILKLLATWTAEPVQFTMLMGAHAYSLMLHALNLATAWAGVAAGFELIANDGVPALADTVVSMADGLVGVIEVLKTLASYTEEPVELSEDMRGAAQTLAEYAFELADIWATVAVGFDLIANDGVSALADTIGSANDGIAAVVELLALFASLNEDPVIIVDNLGSMMLELSQHAYALADIFAGVAAGFDLVTNDGVAAVADALGNAADAISGVIDIMDAIAVLSERSITLPDNWQDMAEDILTDARIIADALVEAARGFDEIAGEQASAMADAASSAFDAIGSALEIFPEMANFLGGYTGLTEGIKTVLGLLVSDIVTVFETFARVAMDADITEAATQAASALADGFGSALDALGGAFELWDTLVSGGAPRLGFNMVNPAALTALLDPYFDFIEQVFTEFANRAATYDATELSAATDLAEAVDSVFGAINSVFEAITSFQGVNAPQYAGGSSGVNNIAAVLTHIFGVFDDFGDEAQTVQSVANSLTAAVGAITAITSAIAKIPADTDATGITNVIAAIIAALEPAAAKMGPAGFKMGQTLGESIADGIRSQKDDIVSALQEIMAGLAAASGEGIRALIPSGGRATPGVPPTSNKSGAGEGGGDTYYITKTYNLTQYVDRATGAASAQSFAHMEAMN